MQDKYIYLVSFEFRGGNGSCTVNTKRPIKTIKDLEDLRVTVNEQTKVYNAVIHNYTLISKRVFSRRNKR